MLDVDLGDLDPLTGELVLQAMAEATPGGRIHRQWHGPSVQAVAPVGNARPTRAGAVSPGCNDAPVTSDHLDALDPEQRAVAEAVEGPVVVWAGAGTGKTRAVTHRIAHAVHLGVQEPRRILAVTFTTRAAGEMRERLRRLGVEGPAVRTFHSAALRQLRHFWPQVVGGNAPEVVGRPAPLVAEAAGRCRVSTDRAVVRDLAAEIAWAKQMQISPDAYVAESQQRTPPVEAADVARVYSAYDDLKHDRGLIDFDDVILVTIGMLAEKPHVADEVRRTYRWFTVDEFQDVSPVQNRLLDLWLGDSGEVCVVGDPAQTIYSFAGATDRFLREFATRFPEATQVRLYRNYRSTEPIVALANSVLSVSAPGEGGLVSQVGPGPAPVIREYDDEVAEAHAVADAIAQWVAGGTEPRDIAILVRVNAIMPAFEEALAERGLPVVLRGGERFFDRGEVREAITRLRGAARAGEAGGETLIDTVLAVLSTMGFTDEPPRTTGAVRERWESLSSLVGLARQMPSTSLPDFIAELDARASIQHAPAPEGITLATVHAAKGLEWEAVVVAGLAEGSFPHSQSIVGPSLDEERRLFYVAVTRAKRELLLTWSRARQPGGRGNRSRSRFLDDAGASPANPGRSRSRAGSGGGKGSRQRRGPAACRVCGKALVTPKERAVGRCLSCPASADERLVEALKAWRLEQARERAVPAYVIFTDATMLALAETRPVTEEDLLAISGIGPDKLERYGSALLELMASHVDAVPPDEAPPDEAPPDD